MNRPAQSMPAASSERDACPSDGLVEFETRLALRTKVPADRLPKQVFYAPALLVFGLIVLLQRRRRPAEEAAAAAAAA